MRLWIHADEHAGEFVLDPLDLSQGERRVAQLPLLDSLPHDVLDDVANRCGVGSCSTRAAASTPSASMTTAVSALCGRGPG